MAVLVTDKRIGEALDSVCRVSALPFMGTTHTVFLGLAIQHTLRCRNFIVCLSS